MKKQVLSLMGAGLLFFGTLSSVEATPISMSMDLASWTAVAMDGVSTVKTEQTAGGIKFYGTGYRDGADLYSNIKDNFIGASIYFKWMAHGSGYMGASIGVGNNNSYQREMVHTYAGDSFTTHHSWNGSKVIADDTWFYSRVVINSDDKTAHTVTSLGNYDIYGGSLYSDTVRAIPDYAWTSLQDGYLKLAFGDNYGGSNSWMIVSEAMYETAPVPEPATMLLFGTGLVGLAGSRFRRKKKA